MNLQSYVLVTFCLMCVAFMGCDNSSGPTMHAVVGTLTHQGEPIPEMMVCFEPVNADINPSSSCVTDENGKFELKAGNTKGVKPGEYIVFVVDPASLMGGKTSTEPAYLAVLKKYGSPEDSEMRITIDGAKHDYELKLD